MQLVKSSVWGYYSSKSGTRYFISPTAPSEVELVYVFLLLSSCPAPPTLSLYKDLN